MFASRIIPFLFLIATFGLFAYASPIDVSNNLMARGGTCNSAGCNEQDLLDVLVDLQAKVNVQLDLLDGVATPGPIVAEIIVYLDAAVTACADIDVSVSVAGTLCAQIVSILVSIILGIATGCNKYGAVISAALCLQVDVHLAALINACITLCPYLKPLLTVALNVSATLQVCINLVLTLGIFGL